MVKTLTLENRCEWTGAHHCIVWPSQILQIWRRETDNLLVVPPPRFLDLPPPQHSIFAFLLHSRRRSDSLEVVYKILANIEGEERDCVHKVKTFVK